MSRPPSSYDDGTVSLLGPDNWVVPPMTVELKLIHVPTGADREAIRRPLVAYNEAQAGPAHYRTMAIILRDDMGATIGGLWGMFYYDWLFIELLFVPEQLRWQRYGSRLLADAEACTRHNHCTGVWLDTFAFQAPDFYEKQGYQQFGKIDDNPRGFALFFFSKRL